MAKLDLLFCLMMSVCFLALFHASIAQLLVKSSSKCSFKKLQTLRPIQCIESEAGETDFWNPDDNQFQCAGVAVTRKNIHSGGLLLPSYSTEDEVTFVMKGYGLFGIVNSFERPEIELMRHRTREVKQGDVIAVPAGRPSWLYNNGRRPLVLITFSRDIRRYFLGGDPQGPNGATINVFSGFSEEALANAFNASNTVIRTIQGLNDLRGSIVRAQIAPSSMADDDEEQEKHNIGLGNIQVIENIENPLNTLVYNPQAGRINIVNSTNLPILGRLQLSAQRGVLYPNAMLGPYTIINAISVLYIIRGGGRVQIVGATKQHVFNGLVRSSEVMVILQGSAVIIQAGTQGLEWITFETNSDAMIQALAGQNSSVQALPLDVLMSMYRIREAQASSLKRRRPEFLLFPPGPTGA